MTEPDDKTGRHGWASKVPLMSLLAIVFAAGGLFVDGKVTRSKVEDLHGELRELAKEQKATNASVDARVRAVEEYRLTHEALTAPLVNRYMQDISNARRKK